MRIATYLRLHKGFQTKPPLFCMSLLAALLWAPQVLFADISTLERIAAAERNVSYVGLRLKTFSSAKGTRTFEEVVIHKSVDASYRKVVSVVGEPKSLADRQRQRNNRRRNQDEENRDNHRRERDRNNWRRVNSPFSQKEIELIAENYTLEQRASDEKIADYETDLLIISPKFENRPTKHIFFARENGIILRVEDLDADGVLREMFVYNRISFDAEIVENKWRVFEKEIKPTPRRSHSISLADAEKLLKIKPIQPKYMPPGFQLGDVRRIKSRENDSILLEYTDGLVNFTLFEKTGKPPRLSTRQRREERQIELAGKTVYKHRFGQADAFRWSDAKIHFFLISTMPTDEMQKVAESIIHKTAER